jgi:ABC-type multidrug transport system permease subunit
MSQGPVAAEVCRTPGGLQARLLASRQWEVLLGDLPYLLVLTIQAPVLGGLIALRWHGAPVTESLYFVLGLAAIWLGCMNACPEIVRERAIYERERVAGVRPLPYVLSKVMVLAVLAAVQACLLLLTVLAGVSLPGQVALYFAGLWAAALAGSGLGLILSALARTTSQAIALAPLALFPQVLFSEFVLPPRFLQGWARTIERVTITKWSYEWLSGTAALVHDGPAGDVVAAAACLLGLAVLGFGLAALIVWGKR